THHSPVRSPRLSTPQINTLSLHDALPIFENPTLPEVTSCLAHAGLNIQRSNRPSIQGESRNDQRNAWLILHTQSRRSACVYPRRSEEHTSELQSRVDLVCRLLLEKKKI